MAKNTISIRLPDNLIDAVDRRAAALGLTRTRLIVQALERALVEYPDWSPGFLKAIGRLTPSWGMSPGR